MGKLIGIVGYKGSGKTTLTAAAVNKLAFSTQHIGFSDTMTNMFLAMGIPRDIINDKSRWNDPLEELCGHSLRYGYETLGTEWGREMVGDTIWTRATLKAADHQRHAGRHVIIDNVRFPSEFNEITKAGGYTIALIRPDLKPHLKHESEQHIAALQKRCAATVWNNRPFNEVAETLRSTIAELCLTA